MTRTLVIAGLLLCTGAVRAEQLLVGIDNKQFFDPAGPRLGAPGTDAVLVVDITDPAKPKITASLPLDNSVAGPPTNLQITPDGKLALVASSVVNAAKEGGFGAGPDDRLHVIDLTSAPPRLVATIKVGRMPSGLSINRAGTMALVANRTGKSVSVLSIAGSVVKHVTEVPVDDEAAAVVITPDGTRAFFAKNLAHKVGVLRIDGTAVSYDKAWDMPVGYGVYNLDVTPDGRQVIAANTGIGGDGHADTVSFIDAVASPPRVVGHVTVGDGPEGFAIAPDGRHAVAVLLRGTSAVHSAWSYTKTGALTLLALDGKGGRVVGEVAAGNLPEGIAFSGDSRFVYIGNYVDHDLQVFRVDGDAIVDTGTRLALPGQPASVRGVRK